MIWLNLNLNIFLLFCWKSSTSVAINTGCFAKDFIFGVGTSAYQIEGAWNADGKGESIWDHFTHTYPEKILDGSNGDVLANAYNRWDEFIIMLKDLKVQSYKFSIAWTRIMPNGLPYNISQAGVKYYDKVIDSLIAAGISPVVTIYHWDMPQALEQLGGALNPHLSMWLKDYADFLFAHYGDRVKLWITINEPFIACMYSYEYGVHPPLKLSQGIGSYQCIHNYLNAHAAIYRLYDKKYRASQKGLIAYNAILYYFQPASDNQEDIAAAKRETIYKINYVLDPILGPKGDYPKLMRHEIDAKSKQLGLSWSRLPKFTEKQKKDLKGSFDLLSINIYTSICVKKEDTIIDEVSTRNDDHVALYQDPSWISSPTTPWLKVTPWAMKEVLGYIRKQYNNPPIIISENGYSSAYGLNDEDRLNYTKGYLKSILAAIKEGSDVRAYYHWSLIDNFQWELGMFSKFGLYELNLTDGSITPRDSAKYYAKLSRTKCLPTLKIN